MIAHVPNADWDALDAREAAYARHDVTDETHHHAPTSVYQVAPHHLVNLESGPILLSYLDVVVQGYLQVFGTQGVTHFFETTGSWQPVLNDRASPRYPRHQQLHQSERDLVDHHLAAVVQKAE